MSGPTSIAEKPKGGSRARPAASSPLSPWSGLFQQFPYGLVLGDRDGRLLEVNGQGSRILKLRPDDSRRDAATCCELICNHAPDLGACLTSLALAGTDVLPEVRIDIEYGDPAAAWVLATPVGEGEPHVVFQLRPAAAGDRRRRTAVDWSSFPALRIDALGDFEISGPAGPIDGEWLQQRPGELLRYLVCGRSRPVASEQIAEAIWPDAIRRDASASVRHYVHKLRACLEPERQARVPSLYVVTRRGSYALEGTWVDADEFEHRVRVGLGALARGNRGAAREWLGQARAFYRGDFLAEYPYAEWAVPERDRLRELAAQMLRALAEIELDVGNDAAGSEHARDLAEMEPFDLEAQRTYMELCVRLGRRSEAARRHTVLRHRMRRRFGEEPGFTLAELGS